MLNIDRIKEIIPNYIYRTADVLVSNGYEAYLAGGAVRDIIVGRNPKDYDIATNALPEQIQKIFPKTVNTNAHFGTILVIAADEENESFDVEITTYRKEEEYVGGRWPSKVEFTGTISEDLSRRDFTLNAMAINLKVLWDATASVEEILIDLFNGSSDIEAKVIRAVGNAKERLSEDGLRSYRACRLASELDFDIEPETIEAIKETLSIAKQVSVERVRDEFMKLLKFSPKPSKGIELLRITGLLELFMPELLEGVGIFQPEWHVDDAYTHSLKTVDIAEDSIKLAALLHDIGKPRTITQDSKGTHFYGHDVKGTEMTKEIMTRMKFSNNEIKKVISLIRWHMFYYPSAEWRKDFEIKDSETDHTNLPDEGGWSDAAIRRFINNVGGEELIDDLFKLRIADAAANPKSQFNNTEIKALEQRIAKVRADDMVLKVTDLAVNGNDLMKIGIPEGSTIGVILKELLEKVIDDPILNTKDELLKLATEEYHKLI